MALIDSTYLCGNSPYIVGPKIGLATYTTISAALTAATLAGGNQTIYIQPGTYIENITWPANINVIGVSTGTQSYSITIRGNQTFSASGYLAFEEIDFTSTSGDTFTITNSGTNSIEFNSCFIGATSGHSLKVTSSVESIVTIEDSSVVSSGGNAVQFVGFGTLTADHTTFNSTSTDAIYLSTSCTAHLLDCIIDSLNNNCVTLATAPVNYFSKGCYYLGKTSIFNYTANNTVTTTYDTFNCSGTFYAKTTGPGVGTFAYTFGSFASGSTTAIDPNLNITRLDITPLGLIWTDTALSSSVKSNSGSIATATATLTLPPFPIQGDVCAFTVDSAVATLTIQATAGKKIRIGNQISSVTGSLQSSDNGDSITLIFRASDNTWLTTQSIGNWLIN